MMNCLLWLNIIISFCGANLCNWYWIFPHLVPAAGMIIGAYDVCLCCFVNERFNTDNFAFIFGSILSFSAAGTLLSDYLLYKVIYHKGLNTRWYGFWTAEMFTVSSIVAVFGLIIFKIGKHYDDEYKGGIVNHLKQIIFNPKDGPKNWKSAKTTKNNNLLDNSFSKALDTTHDDGKLLSTGQNKGSELVYSRGVE